MTFYVWALTVRHTSPYSVVEGVPVPVIATTLLTLSFIVGATVRNPFRPSSGAALLLYSLAVTRKFNLACRPRRLMAPSSGLIVSSL
jgi:hypothetical protein